MGGVVGINRLGSGLLPGFPYPAWPLKVSANGRYLVDQLNRPFPVYDYAFWGCACVSSMSDLTQWIAEFASLGITAVHVAAQSSGVTVSTGTPPNTVSVDMNGNLPFLKNNDGSTYTSTYGGNGDVSQYNDSYYSTVAKVITAFSNAGILVFFWPFYLGFNDGVQGLGGDLLASGATKTNTFASYMAGKFPHKNIVWMAYGDHVPTSTIQTIHAGAWNTLVANATQSPLLIGGHYPAGDGDPGSPNNTDTAGSPTAINAIVNVRTIYHWNASTDYTAAYSNNITACQASPVLPSLKLDPGAYEGLAGAGGVTATPTDVRYNFWWSLLSSILGVGWANTFTQYAGSQDGTNGSFTFANGNTSSGLLSDGHKHLKTGIKIYGSLPWWELLPANVGSIGTIVSAGGGTSGQTNFVTAAATPDGTVCIAYVPPAVASGSSITIASGIMSKSYSAFWVDPTASLDTAQFIGHFATGAQSFTTPSANSYGATDWLLVLRA